MRRRRDRRRSEARTRCRPHAHGIRLRSINRRRPDRHDIDYSAGGGDYHNDRHADHLDDTSAGGDPPIVDYHNNGLARQLAGIGRGRSHRAHHDHDRRPDAWTRLALTPFLSIPASLSGVIVDKNQDPLFLSISASLSGVIVDRNQDPLFLSIPASLGGGQIDENDPR
jgi:hypothetical protein